MSTIDGPENVNFKEVSPRPVAFRYGLIASLILVALGLVLHLTGLVKPGQQGGAAWISSLLNWGVMIGAIFLAVRTHRDEELGGFITFGRGLSVGTLASLVMALVTLVWTYIFMGFIAPDMMDAVVEQSREQMIEQRGMSEEQADQAMEMAGFFMSKEFITIAAGVVTFITGFVFSLIIAAVMRKDSPEMA